MDVDEGDQRDRWDQSKSEITLTYLFFNSNSKVDGQKNKDRFQSLFAQNQGFELIDSYDPSIFGKVNTSRI